MWSWLIHELCRTREPRLPARRQALNPLVDVMQRPGHDIRVLARLSDRAYLLKVETRQVELLIIAAYRIETYNSLHWVASTVRVTWTKLINPNFLFFRTTKLQ